MAVPAKRIPESVAHLDIEIVSAALISHDANVRNAARELDVPSGDLRKLVLIDQRLADAAFEAVELRLDDAEANLSEALRCGDARRRDAASTFMLRNVQCAANRGYAVAASAASLEMNINTPPTHYTVVWGKADEPDRELGPGESRRDGRILSAPDYGGDDTDADQRDDVVEGELAPSTTMIGHGTAAIDEPEPAVVEAIEPVPTAGGLPNPPPPVMSVSGSPHGFARARRPIPWIAVAIAGCPSMLASRGRRWRTTQ
jgi:hypothetical protein